MPKNQSSDSECDSDCDQKQSKFVYKKPQIFRLDKFNQKHIKKITINISTTQYPVVQDVAYELGWRVQTNIQAGDWDVYWTDIPIDTDSLIKMHLFQKINYYPGIHTLARKNLLGMNLMTMRQSFPNDYNFFPLTWMLPTQYSQFRQYFETKPVGKTRTYIVKPQADCQGRGIFLTRNLQDLQNGKHYVVQRYVTKPYLIDGLKFDLRIYVLIAGTNPLRLYVYDDGLARFATQKYTQPTNENLQQQYIHLTNYAINKRNPKFVFNNSSSNMGTGHKRSLKCIYEQLRKKGVNVQLLKQKINDLIIKTIICGLPLMSHQYKCCQPEDYSNSMCFHVLGFDVMMDHKQEPILIEVNHTPSFATDTPLDYKIKFNLIKDTLKLMHITSKRKNMLFNKSKQLNQQRLHQKKRTILQGKQRDNQIQIQQKERDQYQNKHLGGYYKIYPNIQNQQQMKHYQNLTQGSIKMHYSQNTPIRIKLQQAQKKKQIQQDMKKIKKINQNNKIDKHKIQKFINNNNTTNIIKLNKNKKKDQDTHNITRTLTGQADAKVLKLDLEFQLLKDQQRIKIGGSMRQKFKQDNNNNPQKQQKQQNQQIQIVQYQQQQQQQQQQIKQQQQSGEYSSSKKECIKQFFKINKLISKTSTQKQQFQRLSQSYINISDSSPIKLSSAIDYKQLSLSNTTNISKNYQKYFDKNIQKQKIQNSNGFKNSSMISSNSRGQTIEKLKAIQKVNKDNMQKIVFMSIQKQLMKKKFKQQFRNSQKFINNSQKNNQKLTQKLSILIKNNQINNNQQQSDQNNKQFISEHRKQKLVKQRQSQLPNIYQPTLSQIIRTHNGKQKFKMKSANKNVNKLFNPIQDIKYLMEKKRNNMKNKSKYIDKQMPHSVQITKLISRKINFIQSKDRPNQLINFNMEKNVINNTPNALLGNGGFLMPKMYQLSMEVQKKLQSPQSFMQKIVSRKNINKNIYPF